MSNSAQVQSVQQHNNSNYSQIKIHETDEFSKQDTPIDSAILRQHTSRDSDVQEDDKENEADGENAEDDKEDKDRS